MPTRCRPLARTWLGRTANLWGFCHFEVCFSGQNFQFNFLLAAVATPLLGMDFVHNLACLLSPQNSRFCTLHLFQDKYLLFITPWSSETTADVATPHPRYSYCSRNYQRCWGPVPRHPNSSRASSIVLTQVAPPLFCPAHGDWTWTNTASPRRNSLQYFADPTHLRRPPCTWCNYRRLNAVSIPDRYPLPNMQSLNDRMVGCTVFSKINLVKAYHQIPIAEEDIRHRQSGPDRRNAPGPPLARAGAILTLAMTPQTPMSEQSYSNR
jgi:hypothetical protein